jgi:hypothetical protein
VCGEVSEEERHPWDRQVGESSKAYSHFCIYRDMGSARSLRKVTADINCTSKRQQLLRWSGKWKWVERCQLYDDHVESQFRAEQEKDRREMHKRHAKIAMLGQNIVVKSMEAVAQKAQEGQEPNLGDVTRLFDVSVKVERSARGESEDGGTRLLVDQRSVSVQIGPKEIQLIQDLYGLNLSGFLQANSVTVKPNGSAEKQGGGGCGPDASDGAEDPSLPNVSVPAKVDRG